MKNLYKIISFLMILTFMSGAFSIAVSAQESEEYKYRDKVFSLYNLGPIEDGFDFAGNPIESAYKRYSYYERYEYYSDSSQSTPDFVCISLYEKRWVTDAPVTRVFGDYVINQVVGYSPTTLRYSIYFPGTNTVCSLEKAFNDNVEGIYNVFTEGGVGRLIGDTDMDRKLTIKDATVIQKCVAQIIEWDRDDDLYAYDAPLGFISDFNRDGERNVKDATAIQKHVAGLAY